MITKKRILSGLLALCVCASLSVVAFAASSSLDGGSGQWSGGIDKSAQKVYSKVWDLKKDGRRYTATVWVMDDNGDKDSVTGTTNGVKEAGEVKVTKIATYDSFFKPNRAGYKNFSVVTSSSRVVNTQLAPETSTSYEVELWDDEVAK